MLSADSEQQRHQINYDLTILMKRPIPADSAPSVQGIGLFSHVSDVANSSSKQASATATFLPLGGPRKLQKWQRYHESLPDEIKQAWDQLNQVMEYEEQASKDVAQPTTSLGEKYGGLNAPADKISTSPAHLAEKEDHALSDSTNSFSLKRRRSIASLQQPTRRASCDVAIGGTLPEDRASVNKRRNIYEADRDPRRRGRGA